MCIGIAQWCSISSSICSSASSIVEVYANSSPNYSTEQTDVCKIHYSSSTATHREHSSTAAQQSPPISGNQSPTLSTFRKLYSPTVRSNQPFSFRRFGKKLPFLDNMQRPPENPVYLLMFVETRTISPLQVPVALLATIAAL